jgi:hypothetical protein
MASGVISAMTATAITQPFDMLKTRMQLRPTDYRNTVQSAIKVATVRDGHRFCTRLLTNNQLILGGRICRVSDRHGSTGGQEKL